MYTVANGTGGGGGGCLGAGGGGGKKAQGTKTLRLLACTSRKLFEDIRVLLVCGGGLGI